MGAVRMLAAGLAAGLGLATLGVEVAGCASTQEIRIQCVPEQVDVYVDGRLLEGSPDAVALRRDLPHKIYVKGPGYQPRLVVLEPEPGADGRLQLVPGTLCIEPVPIGVGRTLEIEVEDGAPAAIR